METKVLQSKIRKLIKSQSPTVSVRAGTGTARLWLDCYGSAGNGQLTPREREGLVSLGIQVSSKKASHGHMPVQLSDGDQEKLYNKYKKWIK